MTCTKRVSQAVVTIAGVMEAGHVVGKCRSHGSVHNLFVQAPADRRGRLIELETK